MTHTMNIAITEIAKLLKENKYLTVVTKTQDGCIIDIPSAKLLKRPKIKSTITIDREKALLIIDLNGEQDSIAIELDQIPTRVEVFVMQILDSVAGYLYELAEYRDENNKIVTQEEFFQLFN